MLRAEQGVSVTQSPTFLLVAGEASGDLHGARLIEVLSRRVPGARFVGMGGPKMQAAGLEPLYDVSEISVMGFVEVLPKVVRILGVMAGLAAWAAEHRPDAAILIDAPDFNLRLALQLQERGIPVSYYVAPMAWAWREGRVRTLRQRVDRLLCIYPFEERFFRERGVPAVFVGNPLLEDPRLATPPDRAAAREALGIGPEEKVVALLPGSRHGEIAKVLPTLAEAAQRLAGKGIRFVLPVAPTLEKSWIESFFAGGKARVQLVDRTSEALGACDAAAVCSGTATLETALAMRPMVVVYRTSPSSFWLAKRLVRLNHASIVNILAGRGIVPELLQDALTAEAVEREILPLLENGEARSRMLADLASLRRELGGPGASERVADEVLSTFAPRVAV